MSLISTILIFFTVFSLTSAVYYRNFPYSSSRIIRTRAQQLQSDLSSPQRASAAAAAASNLSPPPAHLFVLRPDYTLRNINKVADVVRNFLQKRLQQPLFEDSKRAYDY
uniref:Uncharacterized protein n=1 Tax=Panagrolaimus sp. ES5 TaxID=591445 RepID=A0AC34F2V0_9BILA